MRILIPTPDFPPAPGGIQILLERLARNLGQHDVTVLTIGHDQGPEFDRALPYRVRHAPSLPVRKASLAALNAAIPRTAARTGADVILSGHIVCGPGALAARRWLQIPVLQYVYAMEVKARARLARSVLTRANGTIAISAYGRSLAEAHGAAPDAVDVVNPGVDSVLERDGSSSSATNAPREPIIVTIARLQDRYKGFDVMLRAIPLIAAQVPGAQWCVVGDGPLRAELEATAMRLGVAHHVSFQGSVPDSVRDEWLARARVFALPSRVPPSGAGEGFGIVFLEAGRFGVPSVAGNEDGAVEAVRDGVSGTLVDPWDHIAVADAISELLSDENLHRRYSDGAREHAAKFTWERMARNVEGVLEAVVKT